MTDSPPNSSTIGFEEIVAAHLAIFMVGVSWAFGGNSDWVRTPISIWGSVGMALTAAIALSHTLRRRTISGTFAWCVPILAVNAIVLLSVLTPGMKSLTFGNNVYLMPIRTPWWAPSAARKDIAVRALWLFDGIYFSSYNIVLYATRRRTIRALLVVFVANALALSIFGTIQKLTGSTGIYFGSVKSPQDYFFASFVYDNHWGAFIILVMGACVGLTLRYLRSSDGRRLFHGPALSMLVAAFLIGLSVPLSGSRACTLMLGILAIVAIAKSVPALTRSLGLAGIGPAGVKVGIALAILLAGWGAWLVAGDVINSRAAKAKEQITAAWAQGGLGARAILYHDTWRMAQVRPIFGWGMGSFPTVFSFFNTQVPRGDHIPVVYHDAHSDWLQSLAETGFVGTILLGTAVVLPALAVRAKRLTAIPYFLLLGNLLIAVYAWIEFPFGNVAVVLAWWLCFFGATQYVRLSNNHEAARHST